MRIDLSRLKTPAWVNPETFRLVLLAILLSGGIWGIAILVSNNAEARSTEWIKHLQFSDTSYQRSILPTEPDSAALRERLRHQFREVGGRGYMHISIMKYFYVRYYMALILASGAAVVTAFCLFHISKSGWDTAKPYIKVVFMVAAATALLLGLFPALFRQDTNIADNKALYLQYVALGNEIQTYMAAGTASLPSDTAVTLTDFVWYVDKSLATLNAIPVGFDQTKVPDYKDIQVTKPQ
jgi:cation transport ATPase